MDAAVTALAVLSYLAGGIPTGYVVSRRLRGIDIREHGSGNPGAANVYRVVGRGAGLATLAVDALKGFLPVLLARRLYPDQHGAVILCGAMAIIGHDWTIFLRFRGGKGVATSAGVFAALLPAPLAGALAAFVIGVAASGHISVGSMLGALVFPFLSLALQAPAPLTLMAFAASILIWLKHVPNLERLLQGRELSVENRTKKQ